MYIQYIVDFFKTALFLSHHSTKKKKIVTVEQKKCMQLKCCYY